MSNEIITAVRALLAAHPGRPFFELRPQFAKLVKAHNAKGSARITVRDVIQVAQAVRFVDAGETPADRAHKVQP